MLVISSSEEIIKVLVHIKHIKRCISNGNFNFVRTEKNMDFLRQQGMTIPDAKDIIYDLRYEHYYKGPEPDRDKTKKGDVWFFIYPFNDLEIYIKIRLVLSEQAVCISFHQEGEH